jgi:hypothetical protein
MGNVAPTNRLDGVDLGALLDAMPVRVEWWVWSDRRKKLVSRNNSLAGGRDPPASES